MSRKAFVVSGLGRIVTTAGLVLGTAGILAAAQNGVAARTTAEQKQSRYQIGVMERVLEGAVEHGATVTRDRLQAVLPAQMLLSENARVRGFRLEGYGVFFDVEVPSLAGTLAWSFRTLDQNDLGLESALKALQAHIEAAGDPNLRQALERIELQVGPMTTVTRSSVPANGGQTASRSVAAEAPGAEAQQPSDPILNNPEEAFRSEIRHALMEAMLDHSAALAIGPDEWLTIAARRNEDRARLAPADSEAQTFIIRATGADLTAYRAGRISREDAIKRIEVRVF